VMTVVMMMMMMIIPSRFVLARMVTAWKLFSFLFEQETQTGLSEQKLTEMKSFLRGQLL